MSEYHCLHDAPSATYEESFCGKCGVYGKIDELFEKECPSLKLCHCSPIIEHPDVQRLVKQAVLDGFKIKELQAKNERLKETILEIKVNSYPGLAVKESTMLNKIYKCATEVLKG